MLYSMNFQFANETHQGIQVKGKMQLDFEPGLVRAIKAKNGNRVLLLNQVTDEFVIYTQDLKRTEKTVPVERAEGEQKGDNAVIDVI